MKTGLEKDHGERVLPEKRRRIRRLRMIIDLTSNLIRSDLTLNAREARSLVNCARKAILDLLPEYEEDYELLVAPAFEQILWERWPSEHRTYASHEMVN
ncbi:MAG: hypothetical protein ABI718_06000 [Acidobacteriota bacterium]